jgi:hypothetical protein
VPGAEAYLRSSALIPLANRSHICPSTHNSTHGGSLRGGSIPVRTELQVSREYNSARPPTIKMRRYAEPCAHCGVANLKLCFPMPRANRALQRPFQRGTCDATEARVEEGTQIGLWCPLLLRPYRATRSRWPIPETVTAWGLPSGVDGRRGRGLDRGASR